MAAVTAATTPGDPPIDHITPEQFTVNNPSGLHTVFEIAVDVLYHQRERDGSDDSEVDSDPVLGKALAAIVNVSKIYGKENAEEGIVKELSKIEAKYGKGGTLHPFQYDRKENIDALTKIELNRPLGVGETCDFQELMALLGEEGFDFNKSESKREACLTQAKQKDQTKMVRALFSANSKDMGHVWKKENGSAYCRAISLMGLVAQLFCHFQPYESHEPWHDFKMAALVSLEVIEENLIYDTLRDQQLLVSLVRCGGGALLMKEWEDARRVWIALGHAHIDRLKHIASKKGFFKKKKRYFEQYGSYSLNLDPKTGRLVGEKPDTAMGGDESSVYISASASASASEEGSREYWFVGVSDITVESLTFIPACFIARQQKNSNKRPKTSGKAYNCVFRIRGEEEILAETKAPSDIVVSFKNTFDVNKDMNAMIK